MPCTVIETDEERKAGAIRMAEREVFGPMLCAACRALERLGYDFGENPELDRWWDAHKKSDLARREADAREAFDRERAANLAGTISVRDFAGLSSGERDLLRRFGYLR